MASLNVPMYDPQLVQPMREELTRIGFRELRTPNEVDAVLGATKETTLVVVNSVCGCAARNARPAATLALEHAVRPAKLYTVFAGQDGEATARARSYFTASGPSPPPMGDPATLDEEPWKIRSAEVKYLPVQARVGDYALFFRKAAVEITFEDKSYLVVPQAAILVLVREGAGEP